MEAWETAVAMYDKNADGKIARDELQPGAVLTRFYRIDLDQDGGLSQLEWERHSSVFDRAENAALAIKAGGKGDVTDSAVLWKNPTGAPYVSSPLLHDGILWLAKDGGIFTALDATTGTVIKRGRLRGRGNYYSSPVLARGHIFIASQRGVLSVLSAKGDWETFTSHDFGEGIYATPVFVGDGLYIRTEAALYCYSKL
jgi:outer membrane protein assembly factor BamB